MKYSENNQPVKCIMTNSTCYKQTTRLNEVKGVLWHSTGVNNKNVKRYVQPSENDPNYNALIKLIGENKNKNDWNHTSRNAGVHGFIGALADGSVSFVQTLPLEYRPWGCGKGSYGFSCNDGWLQFEICEDALTDKNYFNTVYKEACEITAYWCKLFNLDPKGTSEFYRQQVPVITCHAEAHSYNFASNHTDILHWISKYGKTMEDVRADVAALMVEKEKTEMYRVRKAWNQPNTQVGAFRDLDKAIKACDNAGPEYEVYNSVGDIVYAPAQPEPTKPQSALKVGDKFKLLPNAKYASGKSIPKYIINTYPLYVRTTPKEGKFVFSTLPKGAVTGTTLVEYIDMGIEAFRPYTVKITASVLNLREQPNASSKIMGTVKKNQKYTIVEEEKGWGKLKDRNVWINLSYAKKV